MPKKFQTYQCSICNRKIDKNFTPTHPVIEKCDITYGCLGTLNQVSETNISTLHASFKEGIENWRPRNQQLFVSTEPKENRTIPISSTGDFKFTIGVDLDLATINPGVYYNKLELKVIQIKDKSLTYRDYQYKITEPTIADLKITGADTNLKELSFSLITNEVFVFLNGNQLSINTQYTLEPNKITIKIGTPAYSTIHIVVKEKVEDVERTLSFTSNQSLLNLQPSTWSNVGSIICPGTYLDGGIKNQKFALFTLDHPNELGVNVRLQASFKINDQSIKLSSNVFSTTLTTSLTINPYAIIGLLSERQFTCKDRILTSYFRFFDLQGVKNFLRYFKFDKNYEWTVSESAITSTPFLIEIEKYVVKNGISQTDPLIISNVDRKYGNPINLTSNLIVNP